MDLGKLSTVGSDVLLIVLAIIIAGYCMYQGMEAEAVVTVMLSLTTAVSDYLYPRHTRNDEDEEVL